MSQVSVGRIVNYVLPKDHPRAGEVRPAIVVRVWNQVGALANAGMSNLQVFLDGRNDDPAAAVNGPTKWVGSVLYSEAPEPGTWHWPPRT